MSSVFGIWQRRNDMSEQAEFLVRLKGFVGKRKARPTDDEVLAWEEFVLLVIAINRAVTQRFHGASAIVDDVTQTVWLKVIVGLPRLADDTDRDGLLRWVAKIAENEARRFLRRRSKRKEESLGSEASEELLDPEPGPDEEMERMQEHELFCVLVREFAEGLCERERAIVLMYWIEAFPVADIARRREMSEDAVRWVLRRIKPKLVHHLRHGGVGGPSSTFREN
jgi:RNA polymerase sigma factor (sigma-70 family)